MYPPILGGSSERPMATYITIKRTHEKVKSQEFLKIPSHQVQVGTWDDTCQLGVTLLRSRVLVPGLNVCASV